MIGAEHLKRPSMRAPVVDVQNLVKWYGPRLAVRDVSFSVAEGEVVGLLGPNGSGKSTIFRILTGYLVPATGSAAVAGHDATTQSLALRHEVGYVPEDAPLYDYMRVNEYLRFMAHLKGLFGRSATRAIGTVAVRAIALTSLSAVPPDCSVVAEIGPRHAADEGQRDLATALRKESGPTHFTSIRIATIARATSSWTAGERVCTIRVVRSSSASNSTRCVSPPPGKEWMAQAGIRPIRTVAGRSFSTSGPSAVPEPRATLSRLIYPTVK
jgi:ABC-type sugar transport system ATPase subunit